MILFKMTEREERHKYNKCFFFRWDSGIHKKNKYLNQNCKRFLGTDKPSATASSFLFKFILGLAKSSTSSLLLLVTEIGIGSLWPIEGAGLFEKYGIFKASVAVHRLCGYIANIFSIRNSKSSPAAENISLNGVPGNGLN